MDESKYIDKLASQGNALINMQAVMYALGPVVIAFEKVMDLELCQDNNKLLCARREFLDCCVEMIGKMDKLI